MLGFGLIDEIIKEPIGGAHTDPEKMAKVLRSHIKKEITSLMSLSPDQRIEDRLNKYSNMGKFTVIDDESESEPKEKSGK